MSDKVTLAKFTQGAGDWVKKVASGEIEKLVITGQGKPLAVLSGAAGELSVFERTHGALKGSVTGKIGER